MARVKRGVVARRKHKKVLKQAKGYYGARSRYSVLPSRLLPRQVNMHIVTVVLRSVYFAHLWITRINAQARELGMSYSRLIAGLKKANIEMDRRVLADLAVNDKAAFSAVVERAKAALA